MTHPSGYHSSSLCHGVLLPSVLVESACQPFIFKCCRCLIRIYSECWRRIRVDFSWLSFASSKCLRRPGLSPPVTLLCLRACSLCHFCVLSLMYFCNLVRFLSSAFESFQNIIVKPLVHPYPPFQRFLSECAATS